MGRRRDPSKKISRDKSSSPSPDIASGAGRAGGRGGGWSRRRFLRAGGLAAAAWGGAGRWFRARGAGAGLAAFAGFDHEMEAFMSARKVPGGALAVVRGRRLVYARGYGWADRENKVAAGPNSLFRIASISKPFTAVAALKLVEAGKLDLEARVLEQLSTGPGAIPVDEAGLDDRWRRITVRQLLQHTGGWDREQSFDPMFRAREIAKSNGVPSPPGPREVIRYMLGHRLDFDPGTRYAYSNFGYCILGRLIERAAGVGYEKFVQDTVLAPLGIRRMRIGASLADRRLEGEVRYYTPGDDEAESVFDSRNGKVPWPYGGFCLETMDAHGGWIASAIDLARFAAALHDVGRSGLLKPETARLMHAAPAAPVWRKADGSLNDYYYGCGWLVRPVGGEGKANYWHSGSLPGTSTLLVRRSDGLSWAVLFNQRSEDKNLPDNAIDPAMHRAADAVSEWPDRDLFENDVPAAR